ncbi:unnamed protein product [Zymoseptoria tritici ST99CH_1E4]|uniref:Uncharacterized protein n=1 Tax=Zymoseptoria tritici ST99CH_1E4 TaxID=1276532 RepID=A0A2H1GM80_ZYMTR|nr:unnamed protein product [Zymoseptoria tritici ST99CH_1E4]
MDNYRNQIAANIRMVHPSLPRLDEGLEVITSSTGTLLRRDPPGQTTSAFIIDITRFPLKVIIKGPGRDSNSEALAALLTITTKMMDAKLGGDLEASVKK